MKILSLIAAVFALSFNACEQHPAAELPEHYQHKTGNHNDGAHHDGAHNDGAHHSEAKPAESTAPAKH